MGRQFLGVFPFRSLSIEPVSYFDKGGRDLSRKLGISLASCGILLGTMAQADCPMGQEPFTSCQIEGRNTEVLVCFDDQVTTYQYGPMGGTPDLFLSDATSHVDFVPWSGLGTAISEAVTFYNGDFSYEVGGGFDRPFSEEEMALGPRRFGWVDVAQNGQSLTRLECIPDTVSYGFGGGIHDIKVAAGLDWDDYSKTWVEDVVTEPPTLFPDESGGCFVRPEFSFDGVAMGDRVETLGKLGPPEPSGIVFPDGRELDQILALGMVIDFLANHVIGMNATEQFWDMPSGLRVGLTRGEVIAILGRVPGLAVLRQLKVTSTSPSAQKGRKTSQIGRRRLPLGQTSVLKALALSVSRRDFVLLQGKPMLKVKPTDPKERPLHHYKKVFAVIVLGGWANSAIADCPPGFDPLTFCDIAGKDTILRLCFNDFTVTYSYGVAGAVPQLYLSEPIATVDYHPWDAPAPTSESITFRNGDYAYEVASLFVTEPFADDIPSVTHFGWVTVTRNGEVVDKLECRPEPSRYIYGGALYERMTAMGLVWNGYGQGWSEY